MAKKSTYATAPLSEDFLISVGGKMMKRGGRGGDHWNFGWIPPARRTVLENEASEAAIKEMPKFAIKGKTNYDDKRKNLYELWKHPTVVQANGWEFTGVHQLTGSCFLPGTPVKLADEPYAYKSVEDFRGGESVITHLGRPRKVLRPTTRQYTGEMIRVKSPGYYPSIVATACHRFLTPSGQWMPIGEAREGDQVVYKGEATPIPSLTRLRVENETVHCLEVEEDHSFLAGDFAAHNCVGAGGGNCWMTLACVDVVVRKDAETPLLPFWLLPYGRSRYYLGDRSPGEGSTGSTFAKAAREDGTVPAVSPGLPTFTRTDGFVWGSKEEYKWSDGDNPDTMALLPSSRKHLVQTTAQCRDHNDVREAILNGYPCTCASNYAHRPKVTGDPEVLLGVKSGSWSHQMSLLAWWEHPSLGEIFWLMNQWGLNAHGRDPAGGPPGGVWITAKDVDWICRDEVFAFSQYAGFPAQTFNWDL